MRPDDVGVAGGVGLDHHVVDGEGTVVAQTWSAGQHAWHARVDEHFFGGRFWNNVCGLGAGDQVVHRVRRRAALNVD